MTNQLIDIPVKKTFLKGELTYLSDSTGIVIFVHGSGSSQFSPRNRYVAQYLNDQGFSTLLFDLLSPNEGQNKDLIFDISLLSDRLQSVTEWMREDFRFHDINFGFFGASTGSASAIRVASILGEDVIQAVVSRGGRPDLSEKYLHLLKSPTLFIVGENDKEVLKLHNVAFTKVRCTKKLSVIEGATHLFEETGTLEKVAEQAADWFRKFLLWPATHVGKDFINER